MSDELKRSDWDDGFSRAQRELQPHQQRVVDEKEALDEKMAKLLAFFDTKIYNDLVTEDRLLLIAQHTHMRAYSDTLGTRIARFQS